MMLVNRYRLLVVVQKEGPVLGDVVRIARPTIGRWSCAIAFKRCLFVLGVGRTVAE